MEEANCRGVSARRVDKSILKIDPALPSRRARRPSGDTRIRDCMISLYPMHKHTSMNEWKSGRVMYIPGMLNT